VKKYTPTESAIQASFIVWLNLQYPEVAEYCFAFANGGNRPKTTYTTRSGMLKSFCPSGAKLKREGVKKGLPDVGIFWPVPSCHGLFIEFKAKRGKPSKEQEKVIQALKDKGYFVAVCYNLEEAIQVTVAYLR